MRSLFPKDPNAADKVMDLLYDAAGSLRGAPERGRPVAGGIRELIVPFGRAAYIIRYHLDEAKHTILITRIWHSREHR